MNLKILGGVCLALAAFATLAPSLSAEEILVFDWNKPMPVWKGRFVEGKTQWQPNNQPVRANFDWTQPINYANGTYYFRVWIAKMKHNEDFKIIFNTYQANNGSGKPAESSVHGKQLNFSYRGAPIIRIFALPVRNAVSNHTFDPVTYGPFNWAVKRDLVEFFFPWHGGAPPDAQLEQTAFPVEMRFTVVNVAPGSKFSGWSNYP